MIEEYLVTCFEIVTAEVSFVKYTYIGPYSFPSPSKEIIELEHMEDFLVYRYSGSRKWNSWHDDIELEILNNANEAGNNINRKAVFIRRTELVPTSVAFYEDAGKQGMAALFDINDIFHMERGQTNIKKYDRKA